MSRRIVPALLAAALLATGATACSAQPSVPEECDRALAPGALSDHVTVLGAAGSEATVSVPSGIGILSSQRTIVAEGSERDTLAEEGSLVAVNVAFYDSATGSEVYRSAEFGTTRASDFVLISEGSGLPMIVDGLRCTAAGDRVVIAGSPEDSRPLAASYGLTPGASLVAVVDVIDARPLAAQGSPRLLPSGFPAVAVDHTGRPGIVLPPQPPGSGSRSALRVEGDGEEVGAEDAVIAQVLTVGWDGVEQKNTWTSGPVNLGSEAQMDRSGITFRPEVTGRTVGSQLVVIEGDGAGARVSVVDILSAG